MLYFCLYSFSMFLFCFFICFNFFLVFIKSSGAAHFLTSKKKKKKYRTLLYTLCLLLPCLHSQKETQYAKRKNEKEIRYALGKNRANI